MTQRALNTDLLILTPFKVGHICDRYIAWLNDPEVNQYLEVRFAHQTYGTVLQYVQGFLNNPESHMWGIRIEATDALIGTITLSQISRRHSRAGVGFMIGEKSHWGQGLGSEAVAAVVKFAFQDLGLHRLYGNTMEPNGRSQGIFKKLGFTMEATLRENELIGNGVYANTCCWGLLADEWASGGAMGELT